MAVPADALKTGASGPPTARELAVGSFPTISPRLAPEGVGPWADLPGPGERGSDLAAGLTGGALIDAVEQSGLRGRGGAGFPMGVKLRAVADRPGPRYVVANGAEGEPASVKDRWLLRARPRLVLDGLLLAADAVAADRAYVYVSDTAAAASVAVAIEETGGGALPIELVTVPPGYVAGEETSAVRAIGGGPAKPAAKPPRPFEAGIDGRPTLVANVETLANLPFIAREGPAAFRAAGTDGCPGTFLLTLSGVCARSGVYEVPFGITLEDAVAAFGGFASEPHGFLVGGFFGGIVGTRALALPLDYDTLRAEGSSLGCGAIVCLGSDECPVAATADVLSYLERENAKQCGACIKGTAAMRDVILSLEDMTADGERLAKARDWSKSLRGRGACATLDAAALLTGSLLDEFPAEVAAHLDGHCDICDHRARPEPAAESQFALAP